jgi:hypothetical protein
MRERWYAAPQMSGVDAGYVGLPQLALATLTLVGLVLVLVRAVRRVRERPPS